MKHSLIITALLLLAVALPLQRASAQMDQATTAPTTANPMASNAPNENANPMGTANPMERVNPGGAATPEPGELTVTTSAQGNGGYWGLLGLLGLLGLAGLRKRG